MKTIAKWYKWILLAVIFQFCVLLYINNIFLNTNVEVSVKSADTKARPSTGSFKVSEDAEMISVSYNSAFGAYLSGGKLNIVDIDKSKVKTVAGTDDDKITFYRWLPDRDMVIYSSNTKNGQKGVVQISTYEADSETTRDYPEISGLPSKSQIQDIELSPFTNVVYAQIQTSDTKCRIIRFNVMSQFANVMTIGADSIIKESMYVNKLVYQNTGESAYVYDGMNKVKNRIRIDAEKVTILGMDAEDTLYLGTLDAGGKVTHINYQKITDTKLTDAWTTLTLKQSVLPEDIVISVNGNLYQNKKDENKIVNLANERAASYRGDFVEVLDGVLVSKDGNKVYVTSLKEY